jgi:uncharacterized protein YecE (DUF72 family)
LGFVLLEGYYMPPVAEIAAKYDVRTSGFSLIRLHGPDRQGIEIRTGGLWNEIVDPRDEVLEAIASIIEQNTEKRVPTFVNINNHYEGCAPLTIKKLLKLL